MYALEDLLVDHRGALMPHWDACQTAAKDAGARAGGISGSGPSSFWVCRSAEEASEVGQPFNVSCLPKAWTITFM